jgi:TPP-dependent 2-oxoacid decarboxylase
VLRKLIDSVDASKVSHPINAKHLVTSNEDVLAKLKDTSSVISHEWFWPTMGTFFRPKDVVVTETGQFMVGYY